MGLGFFVTLSVPSYISQNTVHYDGTSINAPFRGDQHLRTWQFSLFVTLNRSFSISQNTLHFDGVSKIAPSLRGSATPSTFGFTDLNFHLSIHYITSGQLWLTFVCTEPFFIRHNYGVDHSCIAQHSGAHFWRMLLECEFLYRMIEVMWILILLQRSSRWKRSSSKFNEQSSKGHRRIIDCFLCTQESKDIC